jgi:RNA polymerase sigma-70 factor (sigma-E family)
VEGTSVERGTDDAFAAFVAKRSAALLRTAWLLTGSEAAAQDLVQAALLRTWTRWDRVVRKDLPETYVRKVLLSTFLTWRRRRWLHETPMPDEVDTSAPDTTAEVELRAVVRTVLETLPRGQRAALVLRFFDDLSERDTAAVLGCSTGTVKSQTARALARLRADGRLNGLYDGRDERVERP